MPDYCDICGKTISERVYRYSMNEFHKPLCMSCQTKRRRDSSRSYGMAQTIPSRQRHAEEEQEIGVIAGVQEMVRGVTKIVKEASIKRKTEFNKWTADWRRLRKLDFSMESGHFFLSGTDLDDFTKQLIKMAEKTILMANPYVESCYLTDALIDSAMKQTKIKIVTRPPEARDTKKAECHSKLRNMGIVLHYDSQIHSKIITVDDKIAIASSMNFYSGSSGGASKEAGIVSIDERVVESAANYITKLLDGRP